jgi:hypothetical protein
MQMDSLSKNLASAKIFSFQLKPNHCLKLGDAAIEGMQSSGLNFANE